LQRVVYYIRNCHEIPGKIEPDYDIVILDKVHNFRKNIYRRGDAMNSAQIYVLIVIIILLIISLFRFYVQKNKKVKRISPLAGLAFAFILAGIFFNSNRSLGYGLIGVGVILAIIDILQEMKKK
jgi:hypothetical protein